MFLKMQVTESNPFCAKASGTSKFMIIRGTHAEHSDRKRTPGTDSKTDPSVLTVKALPSWLPMMYQLGLCP